MLVHTNLLEANQLAHHTDPYSQNEQWQHNMHEDYLNITGSLPKKTKNGTFTVIDKLKTDRKVKVRFWLS